MLSTTTNDVLCGEDLGAIACASKRERERERGRGREGGRERERGGGGNTWDKEIRTSEFQYTLIGCGLV